MLLCFIIMFSKYESFPGNWEPFFWLVPRQCTMYSSFVQNVVFWWVPFVFKKRGTIIRTSQRKHWIIQLEGILHKVSACYETEHPYWTFQPQNILKVHVTMFKPHSESDSWSHVREMERNFLENLAVYQM